MRRTVACFFLLLTLNIVLFHSMQGTGWDDTRPAADPINSLAELVVELCFDIPDMQAGDEREAESEQHSRVQVFTSSESLSLLERRDNDISIVALSIYKTSVLPETLASVISPPPEVTA